MSQVQAEPRSPMPSQHQEKLGVESKVSPKPKYEAPRYKGSDKLKGRVALITGGDSGIGRAVAVLYAREGADVAIVYLPDEQSDAEETKRAVEGEGHKALLVPGDVSQAAFCRQAVEQTVREFGKLASWSTTPRSSSIRRAWRTSLRNSGTGPSGRTSTVTSTWSRPPCRT